MEENLLKKWIDENSKDAEGLPNTWAELSTIMKKECTPLDTMSIAELETFAKNGKNKAIITAYANCLLEARKTGNYAEINRFRKKIGMDVFQEA